MTKKPLWFMLLLLSFLLSSCSFFHAWQYVGDSRQAQCLPDFPDKDGWYGGDGAYSISLDKERTLWLFGDSFVSPEGGRKNRVGMDVVLGTTLAISTCPNSAEFKINYYVKKKNGNLISSFGQNEWLWPQDPFIVSNKLYIPLLLVETIPGSKGPFGFKIAGHLLAVIQNFAPSDPHQWIVDYIDLTKAIPPGIVALATTSVVYQNYVYFYPLYRYEKDKVNISGNILARIAADRLIDPADAFEYLTHDGRWETKLSPEKAKIILNAGVSELSVRYHPDSKHWIAVYMKPQNSGDQLLYQTADKLEGPWGTPKALISLIPEVHPQSPLFDKNNFCYAGKEHIEFADERNLVVTYVCNSLEDSQNQTSLIRKNIFLYRPVVKKVSY